MDPEAEQPDDIELLNEYFLYEVLMWWVMLFVTVMAVPMVGAALALSLTHSAFGQMIIFVLGCWVSTWLGMKLKQKADAAHMHKLKSDKENKA